MTFPHRVSNAGATTILVEWKPGKRWERAAMLKPNCTFEFPIEYRGKVRVTVLPLPDSDVTIDVWRGRVARPEVTP